MMFDDKDIYEAVESNLPKVNEYISSHGGDIKLLGVKDGKVYIELMGTCHGCSMSLMTTKMVVQKRLRELIHPEVSVINVDGTEENLLPDEYYSADQEVLLEEDKVDSNGVLDKIKNIF
jgi:Fe-S cluster biogenesis protein NfuA